MLMSQLVGWATGDTPLGRVTANLETGGLRDVPEASIAEAD